MEKTRLGRTNLMVGRTSFGALPIQRVTMDEAGYLLRKAYDYGFNFFDTARQYTDSEEKLGRALSGVRHDIFIATKTYAKNRQEFLRDLETSLQKLKTDYIDVIQPHNVSVLPDSDGADGLYQAMVEARANGMVRFIGISTHKLENAIMAAESGLYDTVQYPISFLSTPEELKIINICRTQDVGLIAMKALAGGIITNASASFAFLRQYTNVVPIWGIQKERELTELIELENHPPELDENLLAVIAADKQRLSGSFCRGCGYCLPCPAEIPIPMAARMAFLLRRAQYRELITTEWKDKMERIQNCTECGHCRQHCPYGLETPELLKVMYADYLQFYSEHQKDL